QDRHLAGLRSRVPMLDGAAGVEYERELFRWLLGVRLPRHRDQSRAAIVGLKFAAGVETPRRCGIGVAGRERPLHATVLLDQFVRQTRVVAEPAGRDTLPFIERIPGLGPAREDLVADAERFGTVEEDVEVGAR